MVGEVIQGAVAAATAVLLGGEEVLTLPAGGAPLSAPTDGSPTPHEHSRRQEKSRWAEWKHGGRERERGMEEGGEGGADAGGEKVTAFSWACRRKQGRQGLGGNVGAGEQTLRQHQREALGLTPCAGS